MIYYSSEIRWFSDKGSPLQKLFYALPGKSGARQIRTDRYLNRKSESIGVKIREGKMEIKLLTESHRHGFKRHRWTIEDWVKCSYDDHASSLKKLANLETAKLEWIDISKNRKQKKYKISRKTVTPVDVNEKIDRGCLLEYTSLKVHNKIPYYTFGFEAFGKDNQASRKSLITMLDYSESYLNPKTVKEMICGGYPKFCGLFD